MKIRLAGVMVIAVLLMIVGGCASKVEADQNAYINVPIDDFAASQHITKQVDVKQGTSLVVVIGSNPTTGYSWGETAQVEDAAVLAQTGSEFLENEPADEALLGAPSQQRFTFDAFQSGNTKVTFEYSRSWETGGAVWTLELTVNVK